MKKEKEVLVVLMILCLVAGCSCPMGVLGVASILPSASTCTGGPWAAPAEDFKPRECNMQHYLKYDKSQGEGGACLEKGQRNWVERSKTREI